MLAKRRSSPWPAVNLLRPLSGFYVRHDPTMTITIQQAGVRPGRHEIEAGFVLSDVLGIAAHGILGVH